MKNVYLSLGSNLGDREGNLREASRRLSAAGVETVRRSSIYETQPRDFPEQPWFLNLVLETRTRLFPMQLLSRIHRIEGELGRRRTVSKGPRTIDIDILLFGRFVIATPALEVPHPRLIERRFVLEPLAELAPDLRHPVSRRTMRELLAGVAGQVVRKRIAD